MDLAVECGLAAVELPIRPPDRETAKVRELGARARDRGLALILDGMVADPQELAFLARAAREISGLDRPVVRVILSRALCGDRRTVGADWEEHCAALVSRIRQAVPMARDLGVAIALENHQDATSHDLVRLCEECGPDVVGVCLDTGNPLAVLEDPVEYARRVAPCVRHLHLKDYRIHLAPEGYRLCRCAAGTGVVDFPRILDAVRAAPCALLPGIEVGAQPARLIPFLDAGWWSTYPPRIAQECLPPLRILWQHGRPQEEEWRSAWERGEPSVSVVEEEMRLFQQSVDYFRALGAPFAPSTAC
jgi:sugar phosphate isomerase/epimerase